jgi:hypothetical protein
MVVGTAKSMGMYQETLLLIKERHGKIDKKSKRGCFKDKTECIL